MNLLSSQSMPIYVSYIVPKKKLPAGFPYIGLCNNRPTENGLRILDIIR